MITLPRPLTVDIVPQDAEREWYAGLPSTQVALHKDATTFYSSALR